MTETEPGTNLLLENLICLGYSPETHNSNVNFVIPGTDRFLCTRFVVAKITDSLYLLASDSFGTRAYASSTYTGLYSSIQLPNEAECKIFKKDWFDFFYISGKRKTGIKYIDSKLSIKSSGWVPSNELNAEIVDLFLEINTKANPYSIIIKNDYLPQVPLLKDKKIIGLETNQWIYQMEDIKCLIEMGTKIMHKLINVYK